MPPMRVKQLCLLLVHNDLGRSQYPVVHLVPRLQYRKHDTCRFSGKMIQPTKCMYCAVKNMNTHYVSIFCICASSLAEQLTCSIRRDMLGMLRLESTCQV
jgi:hypothetical protein